MAERLFQVIVIFFGVSDPCFRSSRSFGIFPVDHWFYCRLRHAAI